MVASQTCLNLEWLWYYTCSYNRLFIHVYLYLFIYIIGNIYKISFLGEEYLRYLQRVSNPFDLIKKKYVQLNSTSYAYNEAKSPVPGTCYKCFTVYLFANSDQTEPDIYTQQIFC